ncbi:genetic suppressor element 1-like isoform X2 [Branchiostoma lanceolatum]|uniref:genetic suppressor element 1-like isoform X2 n=1 Tax=Branchiostoma lanceolatum TaxID=7740 RepID=UPI003451D074
MMAGAPHTAGEAAATSGLAAADPSQHGSVCFVCGSGGASYELRSRPGAGDTAVPYFPFLEYHEPPPGGRSLAPDGSADVCFVCCSFLSEQWNSFERMRTPLAKRLYWLKRPPGCGYRSGHDVCHDAQLRFQQEELLKLNGQDAADVGGDDFEWPGYAAANSDDARNRETTNEGTSTLRLCYVCGNKKDRRHLLSAHTRPQHNPKSPFYPCLTRHAPPPGAGQADQDGTVMICEGCEKFLFRQWQAFQRNNIPVMERQYQLRSEPDVSRKAMSSDHNTIPQDRNTQEDGDGMMRCFTCGVTQPFNSGRFIYSRKHSEGGAYFPFLEELTPPKGTMPLTVHGVTRVCHGCRKSLDRQWKSFEASATPESQRVYKMHKESPGKLLSSPSTHSWPPQKSTASKPQGCYLCGSILPISGGNVVNSKPPSEDEDDQNVKYFPFLTDYPQASNARPLRHDGTARVCDTCHSWLDQQWHILQIRGVPPNQIGGFISNFMVLPSTSSSSRGETDTATRLSPVVAADKKETLEEARKKCFICGKSISTGGKQTVYTYPRTRDGLSDRGPFFPFLATCNPAPGADPVRSNGSVTTCQFCHHNLLQQWDDYEDSPSSPGQSNRWLRPYHTRDFVCYWCGELHPFAVAKEVSVKHFPFLTDRPRPKGSLALEGGSSVLVCPGCHELMKSVEKTAETDFTPSSVIRGPSIDEHKKLQLSSRRKAEPVIVIDGSDSETESARSSGSRGTVAPTHVSSPGSQSGGGASDTGLKPPPLTMVATPTHPTSSVSPLHQRSLGGAPSVTAGSSSHNGGASSFAAALRKLAKQATDPPAPGLVPEHVPSPPRVGSHSPAAARPPSRQGSSSLTGHQSSSPRLGAALSYSSTGERRKSSERPPSRERSSHSSKSSDSNHPPTVKTEKVTPGPSTGQQRTTPASQSSDLGVPHRPIPHYLGLEEMSNHTSSSPRGFQPYRPEDIRHAMPIPFGFDMGSAPTYHSTPYHPALFAGAPFPHPAFRLEDHYEQYRLAGLRAPFMPVPPPHSAFLPGPPPPGLPISMHGLRYPPHEMIAPYLHGSPRHPAVGSDRSAAEQESRERSQNNHDQDHQDKDKDRERHDRNRDKERPQEEPKNLSVAANGVAEKDTKDVILVKDRERSRTESRDKQSPRMSHFPGLHSVQNGDISSTRLHDMSSPTQGQLSNGDRSRALVQMEFQHQQYMKRLNQEERWQSRQRQMREEKAERQQEVSSYRQQILQQQQGPLRSSPVLKHGPSHVNREMTPNNHSEERNHSKRIESKDAIHLPPNSHPPPLVPPQNVHSFTREEPWKFHLAHAKHPLDNLRAVSEVRIPTTPPSSVSAHSNQYDYDRHPPARTSPANHDKPHSAGPHVGRSDKSPRPRGGERTFRNHFERFNHEQSLLINGHLDRVAETFLDQSGQYAYDHRRLSELAYSINASKALSVPFTEYFLGIQRTNRADSEDDRHVVSKLDMEESKIREARMRGTYRSDCDSDSDCDVEAQRAKLQKIASGPALQLDESPKKLYFLETFGLTTQKRKCAVHEEKKRKRRRMLMERSPSPSRSDHELENEPCSPLTTSYTAEDMVQEEDLEDKKSFLAEMGLGFMRTEHRKGEEPHEKQRDQQIVDAFKSGKLRSLLAAPSTNNHKVPSLESKRPASNTGATSKDSTNAKPTDAETPSTQRLPPSPVQQPPTHNNHSQPPSPFPNHRQPLQPIHPQVKVSTSPVPPTTQQAPPPAHDRQPSAYRPQEVQNNVKKRSQEAQSGRKQENHQSFAQRFHQSVLQSTQEAMAHKQVHSTPVSQQPEKTVGAPPESWHRQAHATPTNVPPSLLQQPTERDDGSGNGSGRMNWPGVAVIMDAYQRYSQEQELEREVLQGQFTHLQTTHGSLNSTAETLSLRMSDLIRTKQQLDEERDHIQGAIDNLKLFFKRVF